MPTRFRLLFAIFLLAGTAQAQPKQQDWQTARICSAIEEAATAHDLPVATFARLIWKESRFDIRAVSPVGAQGIAQFMPATAKDRGLADPWDPAQALPASASFLADLRDEFGNFGLAAAAYNAGPGRVQRWLDGRSGLPFETQDYVAAITAQPAAAYRKAGERYEDRPLKEGESFAKSCRDLPILRTRFPGLEDAEPPKPWGVQVAGNFSRTRAMNSWLRVRTRLGVVIGEAEPRLHRQRTPRGMRSRWAVRLGTETRIGANRLCRRIRVAGGSCIVRSNRRG